jgi:hypothetical protein
MLEKEDAHTAMDRISVLVRDLDAKFLYSDSKVRYLAFVQGLRQNGRTSSMAITTSTVSRLSRPRSLAKCAVEEICVASCQCPLCLASVQSYFATYFGRVVDLETLIC